MLTVRLLTRDGGFVAEVRIPPFEQLPDVLQWGSRYFMVPKVDDGTYVECFVYTVPVGREYGHDR